MFYPMPQHFQQETTMDSDAVGTVSVNVTNSKIWQRCAPSDSRTVDVTDPGGW